MSMLQFKDKIVNTDSIPIIKMVVLIKNFSTRGDTLISNSLSHLVGKNVRMMLRKSFDKSVENT